MNVGGRERIGLVVAEGSALRQPMIRALSGMLGELGEVDLLCPWWVVEGVPTPRPVARWKRGISWRIRSLATRWRLGLRVGLGTAVLPGQRGGRARFTPGLVAELAESVRASGAEVLVAVDSLALLACQEAGRRAHLVSLELFQEDLAWQLIRPGAVLGCMTQNGLRAAALFPAGDIPTFVVPNFPCHVERPAPTGFKRGELVVAGTVCPGFGAGLACEVVAADPGLKLTFLGACPASSRKWIEARHRELLESGRVRIVDRFLTEADYIAALESYEAGLVLYDLRHATGEFFGRPGGIAPWSVFNYLTGFPGKAGMCMNAGVPVITSGLPGTDFVEEHGVGIALRSMTVEAVRGALEGVRSAGLPMRERCRGLARAESFDVRVRPFLEFVMGRRVTFGGMGS
jgi:hypothetical protein